VWKDDRKTALFQPVTVKFGGTAWIEGTHESTLEGDVKIKVDFVPQDPQSYGEFHETFDITVTPLVAQLVVDPANAPNVRFDNGLNAETGLITGTAAQPGATFSAKGIDFGIHIENPFPALPPIGGMDYIQNVIGLANGQNRGSRDRGGYTEMAPRLDQDNRSTAPSCPCSIQRSM
jgi:hypothetical protein